MPNYKIKYFSLKKNPDYEGLIRLNADYELLLNHLEETLPEELKEKLLEEGLFNENGIIEFERKGRLPGDKYLLNLEIMVVRRNYPGAKRVYNIVKSKSEEFENRSQSN